MESNVQARAKKKITKGNATSAKPKITSRTTITIFATTGPVNNITSTLVEESGMDYKFKHEVKIKDKVSKKKSLFQCRPQLLCIMQDMHFTELTSFR